MVEPFWSNYCPQSSHSHWLRFSRAGHHVSAKVVGGVQTIYIDSDGPTRGVAEAGEDLENGGPTITVAGSKVPWRYELDTK